MSIENEGLGLLAQLRNPNRITHTVDSSDFNLNKLKEIFNEIFNKNPQPRRQIVVYGNPATQELYYNMIERELNNMNTSDSIDPVDQEILDALDRVDTVTLPYIKSSRRNRATNTSKLTIRITKDNFAQYKEQVIEEIINRLNK